MNATIVSHNSRGELIVSIREKEYIYYGVSSYNLKIIRRLIDRKDNSLFGYLKDFSSIKRWREERALFKAKNG